MTIFITNSFAQNGTVKSFTKISAAPNSLGDLPTLKNLGIGVCMINDMDGDGVNEIAAFSAAGSGFTGNVLIMKLNANGTVKTPFTRLGQNLGGISLPTTGMQQFGYGIANMGDLNGNGIDELAIGGGTGDFVLITYLNAGGTADSFKKIAQGENGMNDPLTSGSSFGWSVANIGDLDHDGINDLAVGDPGDNNFRGAVRILFMNANQTVKSVTKIGDNVGGFTSLMSYDQFGKGLASLGDLDKDGNPDIMVGAPSWNVNGKPRVYSIFLNTDGTVKSYNTMETGTTSFPDTVQATSYFGGEVCAIGDLDGDSVVDMAISDSYFDTAGTDKGRIWIAFMKPDGSAKSFQRIGEYVGGFNNALDSIDVFGDGMCPIGDFNNDGIFDICVSAPLDDDGDPSNWERNSGALYFLHLDGVPIPSTSVKEVVSSLKKQFLIYPNPTDDRLTIQSKNVEKISRIDILDITGKTVMSSVFDKKQQVSLDVSTIPSGTYLLRVNNKSEGQQFTKY